MTRPRHPNLLRREDTALVVVDMQEPLLRGIVERERLVANARLLIQSAAILEMPTLATTQYAQRLGPPAPDIAEVLGAAAPLDKMCFSCAGSEAFMAALEGTSRRQIVVCGVETHICIAQTALDLTAAGYQVHVVADAVSSRTMEKHKLGMERLRDNGVFPCAAEAAVYEWLVEAGTAAFKAILPLVK